MAEFSIFVTLFLVGALLDGLVNKYLHAQGVLGFQTLFYSTRILHSTHNIILSENKRGLYTVDNQSVAQVPDRGMQMAQETTHI